MAVVAFTTRANLAAGNIENIADVTSCLDALLAGVNSVADTQLASPNNAVWRTVQTWVTPIFGSTAAGLYSPQITGNTMKASGATSNGVLLYPVVAADSAVAGKTTKYRWAYAFQTNGVAPATSITLDVRSVSAVTGSSGTDITALTLSAAVAGPAVTFTTSATGVASGASTGVAIADGSYTLGVTLAGAAAATSYLSLSVMLQMQHS